MRLFIVFSPTGKTSKILGSRILGPTSFPQKRQASKYYGYGNVPVGQGTGRLSEKTSKH